MKRSGECTAMPDSRKDGNIGLSSSGKTQHFECCTSLVRVQPAQPKFQRGDIIGIIYQIKNTINDKLYIGMTTRDIEIRKAEHKKSFNNSKSRMYNFKLYQAMRKYGFKNFEFSFIEECDDEALEDREKFYIELYDTITNGYNEALGGYGKPLWTDKQVEAFKTLYENGWLLQDIAHVFKSSPKTISKKLKQYFDIDTKQNSNLFNSKPIVCIKEDSTIKFKSSSDAAMYLIKNKITKNKNVVSIVSKIRNVINNTTRTAYGYKWESLE